MTEKIVVSPSIAKKVLEIMKAEKEALEEKVLDLECEIEELEKSIADPVQSMEKKAGDFNLTAKRVLTAVSKHSGLSNADLASVLAVDLNLDASNADTMRLMKQRLYQHLAYLKKTKKVVAEYDQEQAAQVYFPASMVPA